MCPFLHNTFVPGDAVELFRQRLPGYLQEVRQANTEAGKAFAFLTFIRQVFADIDADTASRLIPQLERHVAVRSGTLIVKGRIDALLGNLVIEFKVSLDEARLTDAVGQLRKYVTALWAIDGVRTNYVLMATDGRRFKVYKPSAPMISGVVVPANVVLEEVNLMDLETARSEDAFVWFDRYALWRDRIPPSTAEMSRDFGMGSPTYAAAMDGLKKAWAAGKVAATAPYEEWRKYLSVVYGSVVGDEGLFLRHSYLATLAKLMVYTYYTSGAIPSREKLRQVLSGEAFREWGIENFLEEDFFSWLVRGGAEEEGIKLAWEFLKVLQRYDLSKLTEDVLKGLYQGLVDPETRHDLGEFYTPEWLAEWIVDELLPKGTLTALDPAAGSGTFLVAAIRKKRAVLGLEPHLLLTQVLTSVKGMDVHPLAVLISKANYLMALGELVKYKAGRIHIPVYLANSIDFPIAKTDVEHGVEVYRYPISEKVSLAIPRETVEKEIVGELIEAVSRFARFLAKETTRAEPSLFDKFLGKEVPQYAGISKGAKDALWDTCRTLSRLIESNQDTIYAFVVKNVYRPATLGRFDVVMGNPPWLSYRYIRLPSYQKRIKQMIVKVHELLSSKETKLLTHMELATLFFVRSAELYLRTRGRIGFVMPRSVFTADHHERFRMNLFTPSVRFLEIADFDRNQQERISPLFSVESCVIIGAKDGPTEYPLGCVQMAGSLPEKNLSLVEMNELIKNGNVKRQQRAISTVTVGERHAWSYESSSTVESLRSGRSPYMESFRQGATLVPRPFWFVRAVSHPRLGADPNAPFVESTEHSLRMAKRPWRRSELNGQVESLFIFATLMGGDILPFGHLPFRTVVLPVLASKEYSVIPSQELGQLGFSHMRVWMAKAEAEWGRGRGPKAEKMSLLRRLDYQKGLTGQDPKARLLVMYNTSGRKNLSACVIEVPRKMVVRSNGNEFVATGFVAESSTYFAPVKSMAEGAYLTAFLNSSSTFEILRRIKAVRHVHKKVWELPLPRFNPRQADHAAL